jgi:hypothetical protein
VKYLSLAMLLIFSSAANAGKLWNLFFPPNDLYERLCVIDLERTDKENDYECRSTHKYPGWYIVSLYIKGQARPYVTYNISPNIKLVVSVAEKAKAIPISVKLGWLGERKNGKGMTLFSYEVPKDIPQGVDASFGFTVSGINSELPKEFGEVYLAIEKTMDK